MQRLREILPARTAISPESTDASFVSAWADDEVACPRCRGARFLRANVPVEHPDFGRIVPCSCARQESEHTRIDRLARYSNIGPLARHTFRTLIARGRSAASHDQEQYRRCVDDARTFAESPDGWLVLCGASGCGKTHIAAAIVNALIARGSPALFVVVPDLLDHLRSAYQPGADVHYDELFERVRNAPVLVLDDLGTQAHTAWAQEKLFQLINHRFNTRLPTVVTTNQMPEQMDDRLRTRLTDAGLARVYTLEAGRRPADMRALDVLDHPLIRDMTFERFDVRSVHLAGDERRQVENAYRQALGFAESPDGWLLFMGPHGSGKTHLAAAIANDRRRRGETPLFIVVPDLLDYLRRGFSADEPRGSYEAFDEMKLAPLLILDDLDAQTGIAWVRDRLFQLLNYRHTARLPTVITTALTLDELGERLASRLVDHAVCTAIVLGEPRQPEPPRRRGRSPRK
ncbi:MAG TPA: ATP-binding protein [Dehalococcoidia bacterium]|nr:ATP-binding protein [Dehalococcoidia bacterium]